MRRKTTTAEVAARVFGRHSTTVVEAQARRGEGAWYRLAPLATVVRFEPDRAEIERHARQVGAASVDRFVAAVPSARAGLIDRHLTDDATFGSVLPPDAASVARFPLLRGAQSRGVVQARRVRVDEQLRELGCDEVAFLRIDGRGAELEVIEGARGALQGCLGVEVVAWFAGVFAGQAAFWQVDRALVEAGFVPWRLSSLEHVCERHTSRLGRGETARFDGVEASSLAGSGRLLRGQALYLRDHAALPVGDREAVRRLVTLGALLDAAGDLDGAAASLRRVVTAPRDALFDDERAALLAHLGEIDRELS